MYLVYCNKECKTVARHSSFKTCLQAAMELYCKLDEKGTGEGVVIEYNGWRLLSIHPEDGDCTWYPTRTSLSGDGDSWFNSYWFPCKESAQSFADYLGESRCPPGGFFKHKGRVSPAGDQWLVTQIGGRDI